MERLFLFLTLAMFSHGVDPTSVYGPLVKFIQSKTSPMVIPRTSADKPLVVDFQAGWLDIQEVDYRNNEIEGVFGTSITWNTGILWDPSSFNNKTYVVLPDKNVYYPAITIVNVAEKMKTLLGNRVTFNAKGFASMRSHFHGTIFCNKELQESNTCRIRVASYSTPSDSISFLEPSKRPFDMGKIYSKYYFNGSRFNVTSQHYEIQKVREEKVEMDFEYMDYVFSLEEKEKNVKHEPFKAIFEFH